MKILITGGNSLIAQAIAKERIKAGDRLVLTASNSSSLEALNKSCMEKSISAHTILFDLLNPSLNSVELENHLGDIDALILNAATPVSRLDYFHNCPPREIEDSIQANINGNVFLLHKVLPHMMGKNFGRIVFISSISATHGTAKYGTYCLTKAALEGLILNLAVDYAEYNILSNILRLGIFKTHRTEAFWSREKYVKRASAVIPQGVLGEPEFIPQIIAPLLSTSQYINGSIINVSGGLPLMKANSLALT